MNNPQYIIVHHSITPRDLDMIKTENSINTTHKNRGFPKSSLGFYVGYHYMIFGNGELRQYRQENEEGAHTKEQGMNFKSIGICVIGDFDKEEPSKEQMESLEKLMGALIRTYNIPLTNIYPHREFAFYKSCYGSKLADDWARNLIKMSNVIFVHKEGTQEYGFYVPAMNESALRDKAKNFGLNIIKSDGTIDYEQAINIKEL